MIIKTKEEKKQFKAMVGIPYSKASRDDLNRRIRVVDNKFRSLLPLSRDQDLKQEIKGSINKLKTTLRYLVKMHRHFNQESGVRYRKPVLSADILKGFSQK
jgi:hypothetical protein